MASAGDATSVEVVARLQEAERRLLELEARLELDVDEWAAAPAPVGTYVESALRQLRFASSALR